MNTTGTATVPGEPAKSAAAQVDIITGRRRIAHEIGKSERQVSRLVRAGVLPATRCDQPNRPLAVRSADLGKVR